MLRPHGEASGEDAAAVQEEDVEAGKGWKMRRRTKTATSVIEEEEDAEDDACC